MKVTSIYTMGADYKQHTGKMKITVIIINQFQVIGSMVSAQQVS